MRRLESIRRWRGRGVVGSFVLLAAIGWNSCADGGGEAEARDNATRAEAVDSVVRMMRAGLPAGWKVESEAGEFVPRYWTKAGKGVEIRVTEPGVPGAQPTKTFGNGRRFGGIG